MVEHLTSRLYVLLPWNWETRISGTCWAADCEFESLFPPAKSLLRTLNLSIRLSLSRGHGTAASPSLIRRSRLASPRRKRQRAPDREVDRDRIVQHAAGPGRITIIPGDVVEFLGESRAVRAEI